MSTLTISEMCHLKVNIKKTYNNVDFLIKSQLQLVKSSCKINLCEYYVFMITGIAGDYILDEHGDRDVVFSLIYTNTNNEVSNKSPPTEYTRFICQGNYGNVGIVYKATILILTESTHSSLGTGCNQFVLSDIKA